MLKFRILSVVVLFTFCNLVYAQAYWDIRGIANSNNTNLSLTLSDKTPYLNIQVSQAKAIIEIVDKYSALSGIYPKVYLRQSKELNAFAYFNDGTPLVVIDKPMYDLLVKDRGAAAALIGHEMAHLYFKHSDARAQVNANAEAAGILIGNVLELFFIGRFGVVGIGANLGSALSSGISGAYTRPQESEADKQGVIWAIQAGFDPNGAIRLFTAIEKKTGNSLVPFLNSHPNPSERIDSAKMVADLYGKYKNLELLSSPELQALNRKIDEDRERQLPKSEASKAGAIAFSKNDYATAKIHYEECAKSGEMACANNLGVLYQFGLGVSVDKKKAVEYFKQASEKGSGLAMHNYIVLYAGGNDGQVDTSKIIALNKEASERGSAQSMGTLAVSAFMTQSFGFPREWQNKVDSELPKQTTLLNYAKAAAMRGVKDGQTALGYFYLNGYGVTKNIDLAENYLMLASKSNDIRADAALVALYEDEKIDLEKAKRIKDKYKNNPSASAALSALMANYYCKATASPEINSKCFDLAKKEEVLFMVLSFMDTYLPRV